MRLTIADPRLEKRVEQDGDGFMALLGFIAVRFSQPRNTMQTRGIPDRKYYHPTKGITLWWEAKTERGKQTPDQRAFQVNAESCGETYIVGTDAELITWARDQGLIR